MRTKGFSLLELLITLLLLSILMAIAYPNYQAYLRRIHRQEASLRLIQLSTTLERYHFKYHTYEGATLADLNMPTDIGDLYHLAIDEQSQSNYNISAEPKFLDSDCGTLSVNAQQRKSISGWGTVASCW